jgi:hypothetical protein
MGSQTLQNLPWGSHDLALPNNENVPAQPAEFTGGSAISLGVHFDLHTPKDRVAPWDFGDPAVGSVMAVPETPVDQHDSPVPRQDDVGSRRQPPGPKRETIAGAVEDAAHHEFRLGAGSPDSTHDPAALPL